MKEQGSIYILGVGNFTYECIEIAHAGGYVINGLYHYNDNKIGEIDLNYKIIGSFKDLFAKDSLEGMNFMLSMDDIVIRKELFEKITSKNGLVPTIVHSSVAS